ncbi:hypothetical protein ACRAWD_26815 [Caulobacter segnis]
MVIDLIRLARVARDQVWAASLEAACAYYMKHPPQQMNDETARSLTAEFIRQARPASGRDRVSQHDDPDGAPFGSASELSQARHRRRGPVG